MKNKNKLIAKIHRYSIDMIEMCSTFCQDIALCKYIFLCPDYQTNNHNLAAGSQLPQWFISLYHITIIYRMVHVQSIFFKYKVKYRNEHAVILEANKDSAQVSHVYFLSKRTTIRVAQVSTRRKIKLGTRMNIPIYIHCIILHYY